MLSYGGKLLRLLDMHHQTRSKRTSGIHGATSTNQASPSLLNLGTDILVIITDLLPVRDAKSMSMVNWTLHKIARYSSHRSLKLDLTEGGFAATEALLIMMENEQLLPAVRSLEIVDVGETFIRRPKKQKPWSLLSIPRAVAGSWASTSPGDRVARLCEFIPCMTGLRHVKWHGISIPRTAIETLEQCPDVKLSAGLSLSYRPTDNIADNVLYGLQGSHNLHALEVELCYTDAEECLTVTRPLKDILLSCPNLRVLELNIGMPKDGCVVYGTPPEYCGIGFTNGQRPPALKELNLVEYPFGFKNKVSLVESEPLLSFFTRSQGYPEEGSEEDYWVEKFDWSRLERFQSPDVAFALKLMPKLESLKEINFHESWDAEKTVEFFLQVPALLEDISAQKFEQVTVEGVLRHGSTLRRLTLHQTEHTEWRENAIGDIFLHEIREGCPYIEKLELDVARADDWPYHTLDILASFPRLDELDVWFELGTTERDDPVKPFVTFSEAAMLFTYLHDRNPRLRNLTVHSGSPAGIGHGHPTPQAFWPHYNSTAFVCVLSDRDDEAAQGKFTITCTTVGERENDWLRRMMNNRFRDELERKFEKFQKTLPSDLGHGHRREALKVAWKGPSPIDQWNAHY